MRDKRLQAIGQRQRNVITRRQLLALGHSAKAIEHQLAVRRLHRMWPGVYALGTPPSSLTQFWMGALLVCGEGAALSHGDTAAFLRIGRRTRGRIHVSVPAHRNPKGKGIVVHRRARFATTTHRGIPITTPAQTIADIAPSLTLHELDQTISQADFSNLIKVPALLTAVENLPPTPGVAKLKRRIHRYTFTMTRSRLERRFLRIIARAGLPMPLTCVYVNGFEVDFYWPELGLIVEADGGSAHRTPAQQTADRRRDQAHTAAGLTVVRFTHAQIAYEPGYVGDYMSSIVSASSPTSRNCV